jgi:hypothetical protein
MSCLSACPNQLGDEFNNIGGANTLEEVLANGNVTGPHNIEVSAGRSINASGAGSTVSTRTLYLDSLAPLTFPIGTQIGVLGGLTFPGDMNLRNNAQSGGTAVTIDSIPVAPTTQANVVSYNPTTKNLYYQSAGGGGTVTSVSAGTNISVTGTASAPIVNLRAPLTSQLDVGTQDITTSIINSDIEILPTSVDGTSATNSKAVKINCIGIGGQAYPALILTNTNTTGSVALEIYKEKPTAGADGDVLFNQSVYGKDSANARSEFTRITHTIRDRTAGIEDGSIEFGCFVNGSNNTLLQLNGNENQINCLTNLDMNDKDITTTVGTLDLTTTSTGTDIRLQPRLDQDILLTTTGSNGNIALSASNAPAPGTTQNITPIQWAVQTGGSIGMRTTGTGSLALQAQGSGGIEINSRFGGGTGNITTGGDIAVSNFNITGIKDVGLQTGGFGQPGQSLVSGGGLGSRWNYNMAGCSIAGTGGSSSLTSGSFSDIVGGLTIPITAGSIVLSPVNKYKVTINGTFSGVNADVRMYMEVTPSGGSAVGGQTFNSANDLYYYTVDVNFSGSGNHFTSYSFSDVFPVTLAFAGTAGISLFVEPGSGSHSIANNRHQITIEPLYN